MTPLGLVMGMVRVSASGPLDGVKVMVMVQADVGVRVEQVVVGWKFGRAVVGVAIWSCVEPVLVRRMVCWVAAAFGVLLKMRAVGLRERPESAEAKPLRVATAAPLVVGMVRVPVREPVAVGVNAIWREQEAF